MPCIQYQRGYDFVKSHQEFNDFSAEDIQASINIYKELDETCKDYIAGIVAGFEELLESRQGVAV